MSQKKFGRPDLTHSSPRFVCNGIISEMVLRMDST